MVFPILGANTESALYQIDNSIRWRPAGNAQMSQGNGTPTSQKIWTWSAWVKTAKDFDTDSETTLYSATGTGGNGANITFSNNALKFQSDSGASGTDFSFFFGNPARQFEDPSAWYHIVCAMDSTQGTAANRTRGYINGVEISGLSNNVAATQNDDYDFCSNRDSAIGKNITSNGNYFDGYMCEIHLIDGQQLAASDFGKSEADSGIWIPKKYGGTFGNNGWYIPGSSVTVDSSGNGNNFGSSNCVITTDTPTNNFCTLNSVTNSSYTTLSEGNLKTTGNSASNNGNTEATMAVANGKWYWEHKMTTSASPYYPTTGALKPETVGRLLNGGTNAMVGVVTDSVGYEFDGDRRIGNTSTDDHFASLSNGDILGIALDMDNGAVYFSKAGTWQNSSDPTSGASKTNAAHTWTADGRYMMAGTASYNSSVAEINFGNPSFSISSGNADANGYGNFEYAVPSGFYALCSKNLAEYG